MSLAFGTGATLLPGTTPPLSVRTSIPRGGDVGWSAAMIDIQHQAEHWDTPEHGELGHLIAQALRAAVDIARSGGLRCEHHGGCASVPESVLRMLEESSLLAPPRRPEGQQPRSSA